MRDERKWGRDNNKHGRCPVNSYKATLTKVETKAKNHKRQLEALNSTNKESSDLYELDILGGDDYVNKSSRNHSTLPCQSPKKRFKENKLYVTPQSIGCGELWVVVKMWRKFVQLQ